jgi:hypothetical protein
LLYSTHLFIILQGQTYRTPKRPVTETKDRLITSSNNDSKLPFRPEKGYEVTGIVGSDSDKDEDESPPKEQRVPYDPEHAKRNKLRCTVERKAREDKEQERRQKLMRHQTRENSKSTSPVCKTSQWDNPKTHEAQRKKSSSRPPKGPNEYKKKLQHGVGGPESPKLQRLLAGITIIGVNNIFSYVPSFDEPCVLALGLSYIPESKDISNFKILQAFNEFEETLLASEKRTQHTSDEY